MSGSPHALLNDIALFDILDDAQKTHLLARMTVEPFKLGQTFHRRGESWDAFYVVVSGRVRVVGAQADGKEVNVGLLGAGDPFGESALLETEEAGFTYRAASEGQLLRLSRSDFRALVEADGELMAYFDRYLAHEAMRLFLKRSTVLAPVGFGELRSLLDRMTVHDYAPGQPIVTEGEEGDAFYIISSGTVEVLKTSAGGKRLNRLFAGDFFGELALLTDSPRRATVRAESPVTVFRLSKDDFGHVIATWPKVRDMILSVASGYSELKPPGDDRTKPETAAAAAVADIAVLPHGKAEAAPATVSADEASAGERSETSASQPERRPGARFRFPLVMQQNEMDCGAACLAMICRHAGKRVSLNRLRELAGVGRDGTTLHRLADAAEAVGFSARGVETSANRLQDAPVPFIAHWNGNHYVVVYRVAGGSVFVADPAKGRLRLARQDFAKGWTGKALFLSPSGTGAADEPDEPASSWKRYMPYFRTYRRELARLLFISLFVQLLGMAVPMFTQAIIDHVLVSRDRPALHVLFGGMLVVTLCMLVFDASRKYLAAYIFQRIDIAMVSDFYDSVLRLPLSWFKSRKAGDVLTRVGEHATIREFMTTTAIGSLLSLLTAIVFSMLMFAYHPRLALIALVFIPLFAALVLIVTPMMKANSRRQFRANADTHNRMVETVVTLETVKALAVERHARQQITDKLEHAAAVRLDGSLLQVMSGSIGGMLQQLGSLSVLAVGASLVMNEEMTLGQLMAFAFVYASLIGAVVSLIEAADRYQDVRVSLERLDDVYGTAAETKNAATQIRLSALKGHIVFEQLTFRYEPEGRNTLQNINLEILPGQTVAFTGRSGAGKSTLTHLLLKLYEPTGGKLAVDGFDIRQINPGWLRGSVGVVQQDAALFSGTVRENIAWRRPEEASFEQVVNAAKLAGAHEFISALPLGYETQIGERGAALSGGQRQRIAIARALLGDPPVLIFDEATSALDTESERLLQRSLDDTLKDRTTIIIAHRLSAVRQADLIVVLDQGMIVEAGTHEELLAARSLYYYLHQQQLG